MRITLPLQIISIQKQGFHLIVKIKVNRKSARMVVDTGASQTVLDHVRIHHFVEEREFKKSESLSTGLGTNTIESHIAHIHTIQFGNLIINDLSLLLLDLSMVNTSYEQIGIKSIDGIIGSDILVNHHAVIDFQKKSFEAEEMNNSRSMANCRKIYLFSLDTDLQMGTDLCGIEIRKD